MSLSLQCKVVCEDKKLIIRCDDPLEPVSQIIDNGRNTFTFDIYDALRKQDADHNIFSSPLSLQIVLALAYTGAGGYTARELAVALKLPFFKEEYLDGYAALVEVLKDPALDVATAMFVGDTFPLRQKFNEQALHYFKAGAKTVKFRKSHTNAAALINNWVEKKTRGKITDLIADGSLDPSTKMILVNAVHFKANWKYPFTKERTHKQKFFCGKTKSIETDMMYLNEVLPYLEHKELKAKILELPYEGDTFSMFIVLPDEIDGLEMMERKLKNTDLLNDLQEMTECHVNVNLPKFEIEQTINFNEVLKSLGVVRMFDTYAADFCNITPHDIYVSDVLQKTFIRVDETGTEAAAASAVKMVLLSSKPIEPVFDFTADHPFIFIISKALTDNKLLLIFIGRYFAQ